jgi:hypothetical protein
MPPKKRKAIRKIKPRKTKQRKVIRLRTELCLAPTGAFIPCSQLVHHLMLERQGLTPRRHIPTPRNTKTPKAQVIHDGPQ